MVGNHAQRNVGFGIFAVAHMCDIADVLHNILDGVDLKQVVYPLQHTGKALQPHAGVDVGVLKGGVGSLAVAVKLGKHQVPHLYVAVAIAAHRAVGAAAALFGSAVKVDLRAGTAGTGSVLPEVVRLTKARHIAFRNTDHLRPDVVRLVVLFINRAVQLVGGNFEHLGEELPCPSGRLVFKVIAEREVAQHLKIGTVARRLAHALDIGGTNALLAGGHALVGRCLLPQKVFFERRHAGVDEQQALVVAGHKGRAGQTGVVLALKKR